MSLQKLPWLELFKNKIAGQIPLDVWNLTSLTNQDGSYSLLTGAILDRIARLENLVVLHLQNSSFEGPMPSAIANLTKLYDVKLNKLNGNIPSTLGRNSSLLQFDVTNNQFHGQILSTLCAQGELERLILFNSTFTSNVQELCGNCSSLIQILVFTFNCSYNRFSGRFAARSIDLLSLDWFIGNPDICMARSNCHEMDVHHSTRTLTKRVIVSIVSIAAAFFPHRITTYRVDKQVRG
uniref:Leucine-rich repeat-containing N-terminal plant-type domain-containing protein n=1 Tax=Physcomitrium patens TaxID=3218 RepID=A0A2K1IGV6_PHYPA|nr:hypothetical protein PHYPA_029104 [Physcomitrium patens]